MIITYVIAKTYWKAGAIWEKGASQSAKDAFHVHLNMSVIYILTFGERTDELNNVMRMRNALDSIDQGIKIPMKIELQFRSRQDSI